MNDLIRDAGTALGRIRAERPLVHFITNLVTLNDVANATLAVGARPVMAHAAEEVAEFTQSARALALNLGTPTLERVEAMLAAGRAANAHGIPILFDPVGVGASVFRSESAARLLNALDMAVIRGNAGEIGALAGTGVSVSGVDAQPAKYDTEGMARSIAVAYHAVVAVTGAADTVSDGERVAVIENGSPLLQQITGAGDMVDALIAAALAVESDALIACVSGLLWFGVAAEQAAKDAVGLGTFRMRLFDSLSNMNADVLQSEGKTTYRKE